MNREILFRAKRVDNKQWMEGYVVEYPSGRMEIHKKSVEPPDTLFICEVVSETVCQYTGLTDKEDKKIFDGDIVLIDREDEYFVVRWENDTAKFVLEGKGFNADFESYWEYEMEVIGNIFDNPELWKGAEA